MHDQEIPQHDFWPEDEIQLGVWNIVQEMWEAHQQNKEPYETIGLHLYFEPELGLFRYNHCAIHPRVAQVLIRDHVRHIGFLDNGGKIMVAYELHYYPQARRNHCTFEEYKNQFEDE